MTPEPSALDQVLCMTPRCHKKAYERGVCLSCLHTADLLVEQGIATRERLEQLGLLLPYRAESGYFRAAFERLIKASEVKEQEGDAAPVEGTAARKH